ncbi:hypothetical protein BB559_001924 [Furculomyces boomerangus]|uniref:L-2-hydroxyglutarate dehydrogenase, mitochondrial n=1 Tax=Furculomyces boomerangus TaxID=61424 RepID=A0A2T9YZL3_9FUNG|nr:hypothetical protein BB559_001924 [Furculomyces boomerangus]
MFLRKALQPRLSTRLWKSYSASSLDENVFKVDHLVIGAGVVGLAVARELSFRDNSSVMLVEKNSSFGLETSSRNSGVIHAGLYYNPDSLKTKLCIEGKEMLYEYCKAKQVGYKPTGKWVVANEKGSTGQEEYLVKLYEKSKTLGIPTELFTPDKVDPSDMEDTQVLKLLNTTLILNSPSTGIISQYDYMLSLLHDAQVNGTDYFKETEVVGVQKQNEGGYMVSLLQKDQEGKQDSEIRVHAQSVVNCGGLWSDKISNFLCDSDKTKNPTQIHYKFGKGRYYTYQHLLSDSVNLEQITKKLIYPVPDKNVTTLGIHLTLDLNGKIKFGPDIEWIDNNTDYSVVQGDNIDTFVEQIRRYFPFITRDHLTIDYSGIRPKLVGDGSPLSDFIIREESGNGFPGFVNLLGIESPGLTSSLAIAKYVKNILY